MKIQVLQLYLNFLGGLCSRTCEITITGMLKERAGAATCVIPAESNNVLQWEMHLMVNTFQIYSMDDVRLMNQNMKKLVKTFKQVYFAGDEGVK